MAKIVVVNVPGSGHGNPTLPVVAESVKRGHEVIYYNTPGFQAQIVQTGATFHSYPAGETISVSCRGLKIDGEHV